MGLFSKKKKIQEELEVPLAPPKEKFPEIPQEIKINLEKPKELAKHEVSKPLFISVDIFEEVLEEIGLIKNIIRETYDAASRTEEFAEDEEKEFKRWKNLVFDVQKNMLYCEKILFGWYEMYDETMPVYVKIDEYKEILEVIGIVKDKIVDAKEIIEKINELRNEEDAELELWHSGLEEVERKIDFIDRNLFKPESY